MRVTLKNGMVFLDRLILCVLFFSLPATSCLAVSRLHLTNISVKDGLSNLNVTGVAQDKLGYIWVATMRGLNRYNGSEFTYYFYNPKDSSSINSNHINAILGSEAGFIYIGSNNGLNVYQPNLDNFENPFPNLKNVSIVSFAQNKGYLYFGCQNGVFRFREGEKRLEQLGKNWPSQFIINKLFFDSEGKLWCCFDNNSEIASYNEEQDTFTFFQVPEDPKQKSVNSIKSISQLSERLLILSTKNGLRYFDIKQLKFVFPAEYSTMTRGLEGNGIWFVMEKEPSVYWIGTYRSGIYIFDKKRDLLQQYFLSEVSTEIHSNTYLDYFTDRAKNVWLASFDAGLDVSFKHARNFNFDPVLNQITRNKFVTSIGQDKQNRLVIATRENGFYVYDSETKSCSNYNHLNSKLGYPYIRSIYVDSLNQYWIGHIYGLQIFMPESKGFKTLTVPEPNNGVVTILQVGRRVFVGSDRQGMLIYDLQGNLIKQLKTYGDNITKIIPLRPDEILFSSFGRGNFVMNINSLSCQQLEIEKTGSYMGSDNSISLLCQDGQHLWFGTYNFGLFSYNLASGKVQNFSVSDGLPSSDIVGIEEDDLGNLWLSTSYGLARFSKSDNRVQTFFVKEGINNIQFHEKSSFKGKDGVLYFGGNSGLTYFSPSEMIAKNSEVPEIVLEKLYLLNKLVIPGEKSRTLKVALPYTREITLTHADKLFSIEFAGIDFLSAGALQYFYMLDGFDKDWYNIENQSRVTYSNLSRGTYVFKLKARNPDGEWSKKPAELIIHVKPAPWFSLLAWILYFGLLASITLVIFRLRIKTFIYKKNLENEHFEHLREHEINEMKQKFFTNISHELRTPLTLIYGLVTQLSQQEKLSPKLKEYVQSLDLNVSRLLKLINQLLTFKKIESESLSLWLENGNVNEAIQKIVDHFSLYSREKEIHIDMIEENGFNLWFDYDKLEKILSNLLSNAIKHTDKGGRIEVLIRKISSDKAQLRYESIVNSPGVDFVEIGVVDYGAGIEEKEWKTIFDRYKQVETDGRRQPDYSGTGIGLNFTKSLVELHKGRIRMESRVGHGTTFSFLLPLDHSVYDSSDFAEVSGGENGGFSVIQDVSVSEPDSFEEGEIEKDFDKTVLIVEDDPHLNKFLVNSTKRYYHVIAAHDGETALKLINQNLPDIVISDIMMPKMDGFALTKKLKENKELCHVPVILLTARIETASQIEGLQCGADFYIPKPFNLNFLLSAIESQLKNRKRIQEMFLTGMMPNLNKLDINQLDLSFLTKLNSILEKEVSNTDLDITFLAKSLNMGRSSFYRKFLSLTSLSPVSYIRKFRINKSIELMAKGNYSLSEISDMTGFSSQSYFSTAFRQEKNVTPSEFMSSNTHTRVK